MSDKHTGPRERTLAVADRLFYEQGYRATGLGQILREAGVAKASFYDHFATKEHLALAYLEGRHDRWTEAFLTKTDGRRTVRTRLIAAFDFLAEWLPSVGFRGCAFVNLSAEFPAPGPVREALTAHKRWVGEWFREAVGGSAGRRGVASSAFLLFEGAISQAELTRSAAPIAAARAAVAALLESSAA